MSNQTNDNVSIDITQDNTKSFWIYDPNKFRAYKVVSISGEYYICRHDFAIIKDYRILVYPVTDGTRSKANSFILPRIYPYSDAIHDELCSGNGELGSLIVNDMTYLPVSYIENDSGFSKRYVHNYDTPYLLNDDISGNVVHIKGDIVTTHIFKYDRIDNNYFINCADVWTMSARYKYWDIIQEDIDNNKYDIGNRFSFYEPFTPAQASALWMDVVLLNNTTAGTLLPGIGIITTTYKKLKKEVRDINDVFNPVIYLSDLLYDFIYANPYMHDMQPHLLDIMMRIMSYIYIHGPIEHSLNFDSKPYKFLYGLLHKYNGYDLEVEVYDSEHIQEHGGGVDVDIIKAYCKTDNAVDYLLPAHIFFSDSMKVINIMHKMLHEIETEYSPTSIILYGKMHILYKSMVRLCSALELIFPDKQHLTSLKNGRVDIIE